jgi:hypothetical protein
MRVTKIRGILMLGAMLSGLSGPAGAATSTEKVKEIVKDTAEAVKDAAKAAKDTAEKLGSKVHPVKESDHQSEGVRGEVDIDKSKRVFTYGEGKLVYPNGRPESGPSNPHNKPGPQIGGGIGIRF